MIPPISLSLSWVLGDVCWASFALFLYEVDLQILVMPTEYSQISLKILLIRPSMYAWIIWIYFASIYNFPWHPQHNLFHMFTACIVNNVSFYLSPRQPPSNFKESLLFSLVLLTELGFPLALSSHWLTASVPRHQKSIPMVEDNPSMSLWTFCGMFFLMLVGRISHSILEISLDVEIHTVKRITSRAFWTGFLWHKDPE